MSSRGSADPYEMAMLYDHISLGRMRGARAIGKIGVNPSLVKSEFRDIWTGPHQLELLTVAERLSIVSTRDKDSVGEKGATVLYTQGLDEEGMEISEITLLNGKSPVTTTQSFLAVNEQTVLKVGSAKFNLGDIETTGLQSGTVVAHMGKGSNRACQAHFTVPANKIFLARWSITSTEGNGDVEFIVYSQTPGNAKVPALIGTIYQSLQQVGSPIAAAWDPLTTLSIRAKTVSKPGGVKITYSGYLAPSQLSNPNVRI